MTTLENNKLFNDYTALVVSRMVKTNQLLFLVRLIFVLEVVIIK